MSPHILHIYGPLWINWYGIMIVCGIIIFSICFLRDSRRPKIMSPQTYYDLLTFGLIAGIIGGRLLYVLERFSDFQDSPIDIFLPWVGGFSVLGTLLTLIITIPILIRHYKIPLLPTFDLVTTYAPLLQAISRIGCFLAGCCFGKELSSASYFSVYYTHPDSLAPLYVHLHPAQLYSFFLSLTLFFFLYWYSHSPSKKLGYTFCFYLMGEALARFVVDFARGNRGDFFYLNYFSFSQLISCCLALIGITTLFFLSEHRPKKSR